MSIKTDLKLMLVDILADGLSDELYLEVKKLFPVVEQLQEPVTLRPLSEPPEPEQLVILWYTWIGKRRWMQAFHVPPKHLETDMDRCDHYEYDEDSDTYYTPEGWYQPIPGNVADGMDYSAEQVTDNLLGWMEAPDCGAQES